MQIRSWVVAALLLSAGCIHDRPPEVSYFCKATLTSENGEFRANPKEAEWVSNLHPIVFIYSAWNDLLAEDGDMRVTQYEAESRAVLQSGDGGDELDPQSRCTTVANEEITVT